MLQKDSYNMGTVNDVQEKNRRCRLYSRCKYPAGPWDINDGPHYTLVWTYLLWNDSKPFGKRSHLTWGRLNNDVPGKDWPLNTRRVFPFDIIDSPRCTLIWTYLLWNDGKPCSKRRHEPIVIWGTKLKTSPLQRCYGTIHISHKHRFGWVGGFGLRNMAIFAYYHYIFNMLFIFLFSKELCSKMSPGEVGVSLPWWCHTLVLLPPG